MPNLIHFSNYEVIVSLLFCPLSSLVSLLLMIIFISFKELRKSPNDIMFFIILSEFISSLNWLSGTIYLLVYNKGNFDPQTDFCKSMSYIGLIGASIGYMYHLAYIIYLFINVRFTLNRKHFKGWVLHLVCW